ncbi:mitochondrial enolase superfamily member 1 [Grus japonensis]|uniref:Mitochondrial enolase superfamily member 1 n=1 Tax=Grus japonensis TaxID=30415 RepID=A0ABC9XWZ3_GRUJA
MGLDGMHPQVLRELADVIAMPLSIIFERSWRTGEVPEDWRKVNVTPVYKKGKKEDRRNYWAVSLTSIPGKVMEQLILRVNYKHVEEKKVVRTGQHGFTKGKSCLTNLIAFYDGMTAWMDEGRAVDVDFSKAFDTISHNILIDVFGSLLAVIPVHVFFSLILTGRLTFITLDKRRPQSWFKLEDKDDKTVSRGGNLRVRDKESDKEEKKERKKREKERERKDITTLGSSDVLCS